MKVIRSALITQRQQFERMKRLITGREKGNKSMKGRKVSFLKPGSRSTDASTYGQLQDSDDDKALEAFFHGD